MPAERESHAGKGSWSESCPTSEKWDCRMCRSAPGVLQSRWAIRAEGSWQQVNVSHFEVSPTPRGLGTQNHSPPWPAPSEVFKLHPQKQVRCQNATVAPRLRSQRTVGVFENEMSLWVTSRVLNILIKTFSIYLIFCVPEERKAFLFLSCSAAFLVLPASHAAGVLQWSHLSKCLAAVRAPRLDLAQEHDWWKIPVLPSVACKILLPQFHPGDSYSSCPLLKFNFIASPNNLAAKATDESEERRLMQYMLSLSAGIFVFFLLSNCWNKCHQQMFTNAARVI